MNITNRLKVTDQQWKEYSHGKLLAYQSSQCNMDIDVTSHPAYQPTCTFIQSGELQPLLDAAEERNFEINWSLVAQINPSRRFESYIENIQIFWAWVLERPIDRIPNRHMLSEPAEQEYFWQQMMPFSAYDQGIRDPRIGMLLFEMMYRDQFGSGPCYRIEKCNPHWEAKFAINKGDMFLAIMHHLSIYLFHEPAGQIGNAMPLIGLEYWLSLISEISEEYFCNSGYFELEMKTQEYRRYELNEHEDRVYLEQERARKFFGNLHGYQVRWREEGEPLQNDPEVAQYILQRLEKMNLPDQYGRLVDFLHAHKERSLEISV